MPTVYSEAPAVAEVARRLIPLYHPHLCDPELPVRIDYIFVDPPPESKGKTVFGRARKTPALTAYLANEAEGDQTPFFVVEIAAAAWELLDENARVALVDHELCHLGVSRGEHGELKLYMIPHDLEEFVCVVERHGLWEQSCRAFVEAALKNRDTAV